MKKRILLAAVLLVAATAHSSAEEDTQSANYIMPGCRSFAAMDNRNADFLQGLCAGEVKATFHFATDICALKTVTVGQMVRVVIQYIDNTRV